MAPCDTLVRVVAGPAGTLEQGRSLPGRGAWLCRAEPGGDRPAPACVATAVRRRAFDRALRTSVAAGVAEALLDRPVGEGGAGV